MAGSLPFKLRTLAAAVVVIASGLIIFYAYQSIINSTDDTGAALPIITADAEPFRIVPDNPGGVEIPNQGSELFQVLSADNSDTLALSGIKIDNNDTDTILDTADNNPSEGFALPKIPEARTESLYSLIDDLKENNDDIEDVAPPVISETDKQELKEKLHSAIEKVEKMEAENVETTKVAEVKEEIVEEPKTTAAVVVIPTTKPKAPTKQVKETAKTETPSKVEPVKTETAKPQPSAAPVSVAKLFEETPQPVQKNYYIQLASVPSESDARALYARVRDGFPSLVQGLSVSYPKADLGARGVFTRIQVGPLKSEAEAKKRCANYTASATGGTCLVVTR